MDFTPGTSNLLLMLAIGAGWGTRPVSLGRRGAFFFYR